MKKIAVFASGNGSNFQVIAEQFPVEFVFSDHRDAYVLERAEQLGVLAYTFELKEFPSKKAYEEAILDLLIKHQIDLVVLAGYMKIVGETLLSSYEGRMINIHPAYLPEFPGAHGIEDAWKAGVSESGVTIHWVDSGIDSGQIIRQERVPRLSTDSLESFEERIHAMEYELYPQVIRELLKMVRLEPVREENFHQVLELKVAEEDRDFIASNLRSLAECWLYRENGDVFPYAIYVGQEVVGFALIDVNEEETCYMIWRLMIDQAYQGKGYGKLALLALLEEAKRAGCYRYVRADFVKGNQKMEKLLTQLGFVSFGQDEREVFTRRTL